MTFGHGLETALNGGRQNATYLDAAAAGYGGLDLVVAYQYHAATTASGPPPFAYWIQKDVPGKQSTTCHDYFQQDAAVAVT